MHYRSLLAALEAGVKRVVNFSSINALGQAEPNHPGLYLPLEKVEPAAKAALEANRGQ